MTSSIHAGRLLLHSFIGKKQPIKRKTGLLSFDLLYVNNKRALNMSAKMNQHCVTNVQVLNKKRFGPRVIALGIHVERSLSVLQTTSMQSHGMVDDDLVEGEDVDGDREVPLQIGLGSSSTSLVHVLPPPYNDVIPAPFNVLRSTRRCGFFHSSGVTAKLETAEFYAQSVHVIPKIFKNQRENKETDSSSIGLCGINMIKVEVSR